MSGSKCCSVFASFYCAICYSVGLAFCAWAITDLSFWRFPNQSTAINVWEAILAFDIICYIGVLLSTLVLVLGIYKKIRGLLLPWLFMSGICVLKFIVQLILTLIMFPLPITIGVAGAGMCVGVVHMLLVFFVISEFQRISKKKRIVEVDQKWLIPSNRFGPPLESIDKYSSRSGVSPAPSTLSNGGPTRMPPGLMIMGPPSQPQPPYQLALAPPPRPPPPPPPVFGPPFMQAVRPLPICVPVLVPYAPLPPPRPLGPETHTRSPIIEDYENPYYLHQS